MILPIEVIREASPSAAASGDKPLLLLVERNDHRRYVAVDLDRG